MPSSTRKKLLEAARASVKTDTSNNDNASNNGNASDKHKDNASDKDKERLKLVPKMNISSDTSQIRQKSIENEERSDLERTGGNNSSHEKESKVDEMERIKRAEKENVMRGMKLSQLSNDEPLSSATSVASSDTRSKERTLEIKAKEKPSSDVKHVPGAVSVKGNIDKGIEANDKFFVIKESTTKVVKAPGAYAVSLDNSAESPNVVVKHFDTDSLSKGSKVSELYAVSTENSAESTNKNANDVTVSKEFEATRGKNSIHSNNDSVSGSGISSVYGNNDFDIHEGESKEDSHYDNELTRSIGTSGVDSANDHACSRQQRVTPGLVDPIISTGQMLVDNNDEVVIPLATLVESDLKVNDNYKGDLTEVVVEGEVIPVWYKQKKYMTLVAMIIITGIGIIVGVLLTISNDSPSNVEDISDLQRQTLEDFFDATGGKDFWKYTTNWKTNEPFCEWYGVTCIEGEVDRLELQANNLTGDLVEASTFLSKIKSIRIIDLSSNNLVGNMSIITSNLTVLDLLLQLDLRYNNLIGSVSQQLCQSSVPENGAIKMTIRVDCDLSCACCDYETVCDCKNIEGWSDDNMRTCSWYEQNDEELCPNYGENNGDSSNSAQLSASEACCYCGGGLFVNPLPSSRPSYSSQHPSAVPSFSMRPTLNPSNYPSLSPTTLVEKQMFVLQTIFESTNGEDWVNSTNWQTSDNVCNYFGIYCDFSNTLIVAISLSDNNLSGTIPSEISQLSDLSLLNLSKNNLRGRIPSEMGNMKLLEELYLYSNYISGKIPSELFKADSLKTLSFPYNELSGSLPTEIGLLTSLSYFFVSYNNLTGSISSEVVGETAKLSTFYIDQNSFTGQLPSELGLLTEMKDIWTSSNSFSGIIPSELGVLSGTQDFNFSYNLFTGTIPSELGLLSSVTNNFRVNSNFLSGKLPSEIGHLFYARVILFDRNYISGPLPSEIGLLQNAVSLSVYNNEFSGLIPTELGLMNNLTWLALSYNKLEGNIPTEIGLLSFLDGLTLQFNYLTGSMPDEICSIPNMLLITDCEIECNCCDVCY